MVHAVRCAATKTVPVKQKIKVRPIDSYKANMVNQSVTQSEDVIVRAVDHVASMIVYWLKAGRKKPSRLDLKGTCWDLLAAKQILVSDQANENDVFLAVCSPTSGRAEVFRQKI